jgi:hypothetical protein
MNVSIPIKALTEPQITMLFINIRDGFLSQDDEIGEMFRHCFPKSFYKLNIGISGLHIHDKMMILEQLINDLEEADHRDIFGAEGWKHAFKIT